LTAIVEADLSDPEHARALVEIIDSYARGPGGQNAPLGDEARARMAPGLAAHPAAFTLLARAEGAFVGVAVCVWGFSTFAGRPSLNIHDLAVLPAFRDRGIGRSLLEEAERRARRRDSAKLTLEVHDANSGAKRLYERFGFGPWKPPTLFVSKSLAEKP
jgi:ribosomal protein S18 acetylase RimI-like enzyme